MKKLLSNSLLTKVVVIQQRKEYNANYFYFNDYIIKFAVSAKEAGLQKGIAQLVLLTEQNLKISFKITGITMEKKRPLADSSKRYYCIYTGELSNFQEDFKLKQKQLIQNIIDALIFENLQKSIKLVFAKFLKIKEAELDMKPPSIIQHDSVIIDKAVIIKIAGGIDGCCIIDIKKNLAVVLPKLMGLKTVTAPDSEIIQASMLEFSNIIIGNMSRLLSENHHINITPTPPAFVENRKIVKASLRLIATTIEIKIDKYYERYNIFILRAPQN